MNFIPNGLYTITNHNGQHRTFRVHTKQGGRYEGSRQVSLLTGPDNESSYKGFGFVDDKKENIYLFRTCREKTWRFYGKLLEKAAEAILTVYESEGELVESSFRWYDRVYEVLMTKKCQKCNRRLSTPESIRVGMGPTCRGDR